MKNALTVDVVAADHSVWSGQARALYATTRDGRIGILPGHVPVLAILAAGDIVVELMTGAKVPISVDGGFFSVDSGRVVVAADKAQQKEAQLASAGTH